MGLLIAALAAVALVVVGLFAVAIHLDEKHRQENPQIFLEKPYWNQCRRNP